MLGRHCALAEETQQKQFTVVFVFPSYSNTLKLGKVICPYDINRNHQSTSAFLVQPGSGYMTLFKKK